MVFSRDGDVYVCIINSITPELIAKMREALASICQGDHRSVVDADIYTFEETIKELRERLRGKTNPQKMAFAAEFLTHFLLLKLTTDYEPASAFFNLEDKSFKKGFDLVLKNRDSKTIRIVEVKSGKLKEGSTSADSIKALVKDAHADLAKKLKEARMSLWQNALNHLDVSLARGDEHEAIKKILARNKSISSEGKGESKDHDVILVGGFFAPLTDKITNSDLFDCQTEMAASRFKNQILFGIQKNTFQALVDIFEEGLNV